MKVVFDTNALLSATLWEGSEAQKLLFRLIELDIQIISSAQILSEYQRILKRDFNYSDGEIVNILEKIFSFVMIVVPEEKVDIVEEDPTDNKIIECALASSAKYIITYDKHLLKIREFKNVKMIKPSEMFDLLNS